MEHPNFRHRVLETLIAKPLQPRQAREIAVDAGVAYGTAHKWLRRLWYEGLAEMTPVRRPPPGRKTPFREQHWKANVWAPKIEPVADVIAGWAVQYRDAVVAERARKEAARRRRNNKRSAAEDRERVLAQAAKRLEKARLIAGGKKVMSTDYLRRCRAPSIRRLRHRQANAQ